MFDVNDDAKGGYRRVEILTGPGRRRKWSAWEKARIVAETLQAGAKVSEVGKREPTAAYRDLGIWLIVRVPNEGGLMSISGLVDTMASNSETRVIGRSVQGSICESTTQAVAPVLV